MSSARRWAAPSTYVKFFREEPRAVLRVGRRALPVRIGGHRGASRASRTGSGSCCRASSPISARTRRIRVGRHVGEGRPRDADRPVEGDDRFPRVAINCAMCHTASYRPQAGRCARHRAGGAVARDGAAAVPPVPVPVRGGPALHRRHASSRRSRRTTRCRCSTGCFTGSLSSRSTRARCCAFATPTPGCSSNPDWGRGRIDPFNPVKFGILKQPVDTTDRQLGHGAAVEPQGSRRATPTTGMASTPTCRRSCCRRRSATARR